MLYLTCTTIISVDIAHNGVSRARDRVSVDCGTMCIMLEKHCISCHHIYVSSFSDMCPSSLGGNDIKDSCTPDGIFKALKRIVGELKKCGVGSVFVSSIIERGKTHSRANISVKDFNKVRKSVNEKLKKYLRSDYVDKAKRHIS